MPSGRVGSPSATHLAEFHDLPKEQDGSGSHYNAVASDTRSLVGTGADRFCAFRPASAINIASRTAAFRRIRNYGG